MVKWTHSSLVLVSYLVHICGAAHRSRLHVSSQRASVKSDESLSSSVCTSDCFGFMFVGAKENGGNYGDRAEETRESGHRPSCNCGQTVKGRRSHTTCTLLCSSVVIQIVWRRHKVFLHHEKERRKPLYLKGNTKAPAHTLASFLGKPPLHPTDHFLRWPFKDDL